MLTNKKQSDTREDTCIDVRHFRYNQERFYIYLYPDDGDYTRVVNLKGEEILRFDSSTNIYHNGERIGNISLFFEDLKFVFYSNNDSIVPDFIDTGVKFNDFDAFFKAEEFISKYFMEHRDRILNTGKG